MTSIDLNADLGEGFGRWRLTDDEALLSRRHQRQRGLRLPRRGPGHHAAGVRAGGRARASAIGAQVSYRDLAGFGRRAMDVPPDELAAEVAYQIGALEVFARAAGTRVSYVKPHGALYNRVVHDGSRPRRSSRACVLGRRAALPVLGLPGLAAAGAAARGRAARPSPRRSRTARTPRRARSCRAARTGARGRPTRTAVVDALPGAWPAAWSRRTPGSAVAVRARSLCLHGDTPGAVDLARRVRAALEASGRAGGGVRMRAAGRRRRADGAGVEPRAGPATTAAGPARRATRRCTPTVCSRRAAAHSARELCPAARTVLLDGLADPARLAAELPASAVPPAARRDPGDVEIPVRYDGPDLAEVAALWGCRRAEVAAHPPATEFRVAFCGFAPGFGYLTGLPARYDVPRRATPRTAVPAGRSRWRARTRACTRAPRRAAGS